MMPLSHFRLSAILATLALATTNAQAQEQTARLVKDINRTPGEFRADVTWVAPLDNGVVFAMDTLDHGSELWTSDGTPRGTRLVKDILPGPGSSYPESPLTFGTAGEARVAFSCDRLGTGDDLWVTDGTGEGTVRIYENPVPGFGDEVVPQVSTPNGFFFYNINWDLAEHLELLFSDGTASGTWSLNPMAGEHRTRFSQPFDLISRGTSCYFLANENEVWRSDGTETGTEKLVTFAAGIPGRLALADDRLFVTNWMDYDVVELWTAPLNGGEATRLGPPSGTRWHAIDELAASGDKAIFRVQGEDDHGIYTRLLWSSDGTESGTHRIPLLAPGSNKESTVIGDLTPWNGATYFTAEGPDNNWELWRTDGTSGGTQRMSSFPGLSITLWTYGIPPSADFLYFAVWRDSGQWQLWRTTGDPASTRPVRGTPTINPNYSVGPILAHSGSGTFFSAQQGTRDESLWRLRGKTAGSLRLTRPEKSSGSATHLSYEMLGENLLTLANTGHGHELWRMNPDGSRARALWKTPAPLQDSGTLGFRGNIAGKSLFTFSDGIGKRQLYATDGTRRGTKPLADHSTSTNDEVLHGFVLVGDTMFYSVMNPSDRSKGGLWKTDGTPSGTSKVVTADGSSPAPDKWEMISFQENLYFLATGGDGKTTLWRSDGSTTGTVRLRDEWHGNSGETASCLSTAGGLLYFSVNLSNTDILWRSDGTTAGTMAAYNPTETFSRLTLSPVVDLGGIPLFQAKSRFSSQDLRWWRSDSTGISPVRNYFSGQHLYHWYRGDLSSQAVAGGRLFYVGLNEYQAELWISDGTSAGTSQVKKINPDGPSSPGEMLAVGNGIYFTAEESEHGRELWRSDGTEEGTVLVADIEPGPGSSYPSGLKVMNGRLYFTAERRDVGRELFSIDLPAN